MYYTEEQFQALAPFADELRRAIDHNYAHNPGPKSLDAIREAYIAASGNKRYPRNWGCTACVVNLMKDAGRLYFADLDERNSAALAAANDKAAADATKQAAAAPDNGGSTEGEQAEKSAPKAPAKKTPAKSGKAAKSAAEPAKTDEK